MKPQESDPFDYYIDDNPPDEPEQSSSSDVVNNLRSDLLTTSEVEPAEESILQKVNIKLIVGIIIGIIILCLIMYLLLGAGRLLLEGSLASLRRTVPTATQQITPSTVPYTITPEKPTSTVTKIPTSRPTTTQIVGLIASPTPIPITVTPTLDSECRDALSISLADVGQTLCVQGTIIETITNPNYFMVIFSNEKGSFYWVTYDLVWTQAELNTCYRTTGTIDIIANSPVLVFGYSNLPEPCP
jgi:hypothetical protein